MNSDQLGDKFQVGAYVSNNVSNNRRLYRVHAISPDNTSIELEDCQAYGRDSNGNPIHEIKTVSWYALKWSYRMERNNTPTANTHLDALMEQHLLGAATVFTS